MLIVLQGNDLLMKREEKIKLYSKYKVDDFNFTELSNNIEIGQLSAALKSTPLLTDYYFVVVTLNKRQFIRLKEYFKPSELTVLLLILEDFNLSADLQQGLTIDSVISCQQPSYKDTIRWIQTKAKSYGFSMDLEDRKKLALMFQTTKELADVIYQMSLLDEFGRSEFFGELFTTRQKFVWELFIELVRGKKKDFFTKYAIQVKQNLELSPSQLNMKIIGGLIYCLSSWKDAPSWIYEQLEELEEKEERVIPFLYSHLIELLPKARKTSSNIPVLMEFTEILATVRKL